MDYGHIPVMPQQVLQYLNPRPGGIIIDGTLGAGGHAAEILPKILPGGLLIGIDLDSNTLADAEQRLSVYHDNLRLVQGNYADLTAILNASQINAVDGILLDLGLSTMQLKTPGRGFSFQQDEPLDMRMDTSTLTTAKDLINTLNSKDLTAIFRKYGEERQAAQIARKILQERQREPITTTGRLASLVAGVIRKKIKGKKIRIHPATRVFMSLRIAVNQELENLSDFMTKVLEPAGAAVLKSKGRFCVLSFHSLEDRIVKQQLKKMTIKCICPPQFPQCCCQHQASLHLLTRKAVRPDTEEIAANPLSRSAVLRAAEKSNEKI